MHFDWFPRLFVGRSARILGVTVSLGVVIPLKFLFDGSSRRPAAPAQAQVEDRSSGRVGPELKRDTRLAYKEPLFIVKKRGILATDHVAAEFVTEVSGDRIRVREVESGQTIDVPRDQLRLRIR